MFLIERNSIVVHFYFYPVATGKQIAAFVNQLDVYTISGADFLLAMQEAISQFSCTPRHMAKDHCSIPEAVKNKLGNLKKKNKEKKKGI